MTFDKEAAQDDVTEPDSIEVTQGGTGDVTIVVGEEERDEHKEVAPPSSPRSPRDKLRSLFKTTSKISIGKINPASDVVEAQVDENAPGDVTIAVGGEERDEHKEVASPSSPRSPRSPRDKLRSLFKTTSKISIGKINPASDVVEAQVDENASKDEHITKGIDAVELDQNSDQLQVQHEEERDDEEDLSKERINTKDTRTEDDDQSQKSETSLQVLFRIVANGLDFRTDYDDRRKSRNKKAEKHKPVSLTSSQEEVATNDEKDVIFISDISATSFLTLTMGIDEDTAADTTGGCCSCATIFENYE